MTSTATHALPFTRDGECNGLVLWLDFHHAADATLSGGPHPDGRPKYGKQVMRLLNHTLRGTQGAQAVQLFREPFAVRTGDSRPFDATFTAATGDVAVRML